ncbi:MAG: hypothetical protein KOO62_05565 [candidate division Zixibacteria bacterium]|nr:hypothetical protein [candidate division Zixibacteria bacterium]
MDKIRFEQRRIGFAALALVVVAVLLVATTSVYTQEVAIGTATATVLSALTVASSASLVFGDVFQGVPKTVANSSTDAGIFKVTGQKDSPITMYFQLPEYLVLSDGSDRMIMTFSATDCSVDTTGADNPAGMAGTKGWQNTDPRSLPAAATVGTAGTSIYLGGQVIPSIYQRSGSYSGDIILTVTYNGT